MVLFNLLKLRHLVFIFIQKFLKLYPDQPYFLGANFVSYLFGDRVSLDLLTIKQCLFLGHISYLHVLGYFFDDLFLLHLLVKFNQPGIVFIRYPSLQLRKNIAGAHPMGILSLLLSCFCIFYLVFNVGHFFIRFNLDEVFQTFVFRPR